MHINSIRNALLLSGLAAGSASIGLMPVPTASAQCAATVAQTEGPYYRTPNPETTSIRIAGDGPLLTLNGQVVDTTCNPIPYTWIAVWHADPSGAYDNTAPYDRYRCNFFTDANGEFTLYSILPGLYPGRTRHTHVKADAGNTAVLTTQLYFPGEPLNQSDGLYNPLLEIDMTEQPDGSFVGSYRFVLARSGGCAAPSVTADPASATVAAGANATFSITASGALPITFQWRRNGVALANGGRIAGVTTSTLNITGVTCADSGLYECAALSSCGTDVSAAATLSVSGCCTADLNDDHVVDLADLAVLLSHFGTTGGALAADGDLDGDQDVDLSDLAGLLSGFGTTCP